MLSNQLNNYRTPSLKLRCSICHHLINNYFYKEHFEHCKHYIIIKNNKYIHHNIYSKEKNYVELFNFLDFELGLEKNNQENIKKNQEDWEKLIDKKNKEQEKKIKQRENETITRMKKEEEKLRLKIIKEKEKRNEEKMKNENRNEEERERDKENIKRREELKKIRMEERKRREEKLERDRCNKEKNNIMNTNIPDNLRNMSLMNISKASNYGIGINTGHIRKILKKYTDLFAHYVNGKTVAIVGPANSVVGTNRGSLIDKFDIIIRLNKALPIPKKLMHDIGSRTDIIYNALNTTDFPGQNILDTNFYKQNGVKFVVSPYPLANVFFNDIMNYIQRYQFDIPFRTVDTGKYNKFTQQIKTRPYTGTSAIMDMLSFNIKALYITGIDFYNTPYYSQYRHVNKKKLLGLRENAVHLAYPQMEFLLYRSLTDNRVLLDNTLEKLLYNQYIKFSNLINNVDLHMVLHTNNSQFLNFFNFQPNILIIGKDTQVNINIDNYDLIFDFTKNYYNIDPNKLILFNNNNQEVIANININNKLGKNEKIILLNFFTKKFLKSIFNLVDIKTCSQRMYFICFVLILFKKIDITGFIFNKELNKKQKYKELLLIHFLKKYKYINFI
jgi:hypothetical protein